MVRIGAHHSQNKGIDGAQVEDAQKLRKATNGGVRVWLNKFSVINSVFAQTLQFRSDGRKRFCPFNPILIFAVHMGNEYLLLALERQVVLEEDIGARTKQPALFF